MAFWRAFGLLVVISLLASSKASHDLDKEAKETKEVYLYRHMNWCITGKGNEYRLNDWPYSQFKPFLHLTYVNEYEVKPPGISRDKFELTFSPITCSELKSDISGLGHGNTFLQRVHIKFKSEDNFQGLIIQAVHAPFGLGFPFGVFDTDQEFECSDCKLFRYSDTIGCLSRPELSTMHPNVAIYHFKQRGMEPTTTITAVSRPSTNPPQTDPPEDEHNFQKELHWNFKWANIPCSSSKSVEFWVLVVKDFDRREYTIKKFGQYNFDDFDPVSSPVEEPKEAIVSIPQGPPNPNPPTPPNVVPPATYPTTTVPPPPPPVRILQSGFPTPITPECYPFKETSIADKIDEEKGRPFACFRQYRYYDPKKCARWYANFRRNQIDEKPIEIKCHGSDIKPKENSTTRMRFVGDFDVNCIRKFPGAMYEKMSPAKKIRQPGKICPEWQGRYRCEGRSDDLHFDKYLKKKGSEASDRPFPGSYCKKCKPITEELTTPPPDHYVLIKRNAHGAFMIFAFFFFNPVSLNTARFYKETFHERQFKGWRVWLIIHVVFAVMTSILAYVGYTLTAYIQVTLHIGLGVGAVVGVCTGVLTGWFRHKNRYFQIIMFILHALSGYLGWGLAIASFIFAPGIGTWVILLSVGASCFCLFAMVVMTINICSVDSTLGLRPRRSHVPIIEIRFDDIIPPGSRFRKIFFYIYIFIQFAISCAMLCL